MNRVSIPIGFSSSLQPNPALKDSIYIEVSIPIGFSSSLQLINIKVMDGPEESFNPYRVFKFVATQLHDLGHQVLHGFNPYRVFKFVATWSTTGTSVPGRARFQSLSGFQVRCNVGSGPAYGIFSPSFNPYRVFKFVATLGKSDSSRPLERFQSLSGFQVRCNPS